MTNTSLSMAKTLLQMRAQIRSLVDSDSTDTRWSDSRINDAINFARAQTVQVLTQASNHDLFTTVEIQASAGQITVPENDGIVSVQYKSSDNTYYRLKRSNGSGNRLKTDISGTIQVIYIARDAELSSDSDEILYAGQDLADPVVDRYCAYLAASDLKVDENEANQLLEGRLAKLEGQIRAKYNPEVQIAPTDSIYSNFYSTVRWHLAGPTTIEFSR